MTEEDDRYETIADIPKEESKLISEQVKKMHDAQKLLNLVSILLLADMTVTLLNYNAMVHIIASTLCIVGIIYIFFKRRKERKVIKKTLLPVIREKSDKSATLKDIHVFDEDLDKKRYGILLFGTILIAILGFL